MKGPDSMKIKLLLPVVLCLVTAASAVVAQESRVVVEFGVHAKMRDGVSLVADVYRPSKPGKYPVVLERTPYDRRGDAWMAMELAAHDYVVILQDTRGRYESEGVFYPFRNEGA